jgi:hypothetical protein
MVLLTLAFQTPKARRSRLVIDLLLMKIERAGAVRKKGGADAGATGDARGSSLISGIHSQPLTE